MKALVRARVFWRRRFRPNSPADHAEAQLLLQQYLDGQVDDGLAQRVAEHIAHCPDCTLDASIFKELKESLRRHGAPEEDVVARIEEFAERLASGDIDETLLSDLSEPPDTT